MTWIDFLFLFGGLALTIGLIVLRVVKGDVNWVYSTHSVLGLFWPLP